MSESTHSGARSKLGLIAFLLFCVGVVTLAILGITSHNMGPRSSKPVAAPVTKPVPKPATTSAIFAATPTPARLARGR